MTYSTTGGAVWLWLQLETQIGESPKVYGLWSFAAKAEMVEWHLHRRNNVCRGETV